MTNELSNSKKQIKRRAWPEKRRKQRSEITRRTRPWEASSGPKTAGGKAVSSRNARKHGLRGAVALKLRRLLKLQKNAVALCRKTL
ncbi:MAG TPA: hypothetical protein PLO23_02270 [Alphaproteobacteria bacterium]|nr:hypothetical protein [Alphaproteobacteria bacterium]